MAAPTMEDRSIARSAAPAQASGRAGGLSWLLLGSLAVNLLMLGALAGGMVLERRHHNGAREAARGGLTGFIATLPADRRDAIWAATRAHWDAVLPFRKDVRRARQMLDEAMLAEPFDKTRFKALQAALLEAELRLHQPMHALIAELAASLTPDERKAYIKTREAAQKRRPVWPPGEEGEAKAAKARP